VGGHTLSDKAMVDLAKIKKEVLGSQPPQGTQPGGGGIPPGFWYHGKLASAMSAGTPAAPTSTTVDVYFPDQADTDPKALIITTNSTLLGLTVVNHSTMEGTSGTYVKIEWGFGQWTIKWADC
jgi:hypothetical protein